MLVNFAYCRYPCLCQEQMARSSTWVHIRLVNIQSSGHIFGTGLSKQLYLYDLSMQGNGCPPLLRSATLPVRDWLAPVAPASIHDFQVSEGTVGGPVELIFQPKYPRVSMPRGDSQRSPGVELPAKICTFFKTQWGQLEVPWG